MKHNYRSPKSQRGNASFYFLTAAVIFGLASWAVSEATKSKALKEELQLLTELSDQSGDRSEGLDPKFYSLAEEALDADHAEAPVGAWLINQEDEKLRVEQLLVVDGEEGFAIHSRTTLKGKDGEVGRISQAKGSYQMKGRVIAFNASEGSLAWNGPYIIESQADRELKLRHSVNDVAVYRGVAQEAVPGIVARLSDERSDAQIASATAASRFADSIKGTARDESAASESKEK